jgi:hypothetical protein
MVMDALTSQWLAPSTTMISEDKICSIFQAGHCEWHYIYGLPEPSLARLDGQSTKESIMPREAPRIRLGIERVDRPKILTVHDPTSATGGRHSEQNTIKIR